MKKRIALLVLALVCLIGLFAITATADEAPSASIEGHNLSLNDNIYIIYYAEFENLPVGAEKGILVWTSQRESYEYGTQYAILPVYTGNNYGYDAYYFTGVSAKMMTQDIYAKAYIKIGDEITYGELDKYSVLQYCYNKKNNADLGQLITNMLNYGASAQTYFEYNTDKLANAKYYQIKVVGGVLPDATKSGLYPAGSQATLTATVENFNHWENADGDVVGTEAVLTIDVAHAETYTATATEAEPEPIPEPSDYSQGLEFTSNGDGTCYVSDIGECTDDTVIIPRVSPEGELVTSIGNAAFAGTSFVGVEIPNSVTSIGGGAFDSCNQLQGITFAENSRLESIGDRAFYQCTALTSIEIPDSVTSIGSYAFYDCYALKNITIPDSVTSIGENAFYNCKKLTSIEIPDSVTSIGNFAFSFCSSLTSIEIPDSVMSIGNYAFYYCSSLTSIEIPNSVTSIGNYAFYYCSRLTSIEIPDSVTSIGWCAFQYCTSLTSITIPDSVTSIGNGAFEGCSNLQYNTYSKAKYLGNADNPYVALIQANSTGVASCKIHPDTKVIYGGAFGGCASLTSIEIPDSVTSIGYEAFSNCYSLTSIEIPDSVTSIGGYAFYGCSSLTSIEIPDSVTSIGVYAFYNCSSLTSITYTGTMEQWNAISKKGSSWNLWTGNYVIHCTDGDIQKQ